MSSRNYENSMNAHAVVEAMREDPGRWFALVGFSPATSETNSDANLRHRYLALLALHSYQRSGRREKNDEPIVAYLLDQEIRYHQHGDHYRTGLSCASYLSARYRNPASLWLIWVARQTNFDASKAVDSHFMYYATNGIENAKSYVENSKISDVLGDSLEDSGRRQWWKATVEQYGDEEKAFAEVKAQVMERIVHDQNCGVTDEKVNEFLEKSWRTSTSKWGERMLPMDY